MPRARRNRPLPYSRRTERSTSACADLEALMRENNRIASSLMPAETPPIETAYFPYILWNVVENDDHRSIWWSADGTAMVMHKRLFITEILDKDKIEHMFGACCINRFIRQLDLYGFTTIGFDEEKHRNPSGMAITAEQVKVFTHPCLVKNARHLLSQMRRRMVTTAAATSPVPEALLRDLAVPSWMLSPRFGFSPEEVIVLEQARAFLSEERVVQALQPVVNHGRTHMDPQTLGLTILLATLLHPAFSGMDDR